jgi:ATP-dependent Lhr-like helicase
MKNPSASKKLHPALAHWFSQQFPQGLTAMQKRALPHTLAGHNTLLLAPTGSGKTLAAFLSVLSELAARAEALPNAVLAVYVSPLRSLTRDIERNLRPPLEAINQALPESARIRMEARTGDTSQRDRGRQQRRKPHLLLTTPESLSSLLSQTAWREGLRPFVVVVDEIHALAESKRGSLLTLAIERLEHRAGAPLQRIGLSATAWPEDTVTRFLCGDRPCETVAADMRKAHRLSIAVPDPRTPMAAGGYSPYKVAQPVADLVAAAQCSLVFTATRSAAEQLGLALQILLPQFEDTIGVHHSSIDLDARLRIEAGLANGTYKAVVCSTSLELGVDFGAVDQVLLIGAPRGVSRALQRLGRSGHRVNGVATGQLVALSLPDLLECVALRHAAAAGRLDAIRPPRAPLDVLAQVLLGMAVERPWSTDEAYHLVIRAGPYRGLSRADFDAVLSYLAGGGRVLGDRERYGKITVSDGIFHAPSRRVAALYYSNIGAISDTVQIRVVTRKSHRLGEVEEEFLNSLAPGEAFLIGGKSVRVRQTYQNTAIVEPATGERVKTPRWFGGRMQLSAQLAAEELRLRRALRTAWLAGGQSACTRVLKAEWNVSPEAARRIAAYVERQSRAFPIPADDPLCIERLRRGKSLLLLFHTVAGRSVNRSLAWVAGRRLGVSGSVVANFDDHCFLLSIDARDEPSEDALRQAFSPQGWCNDLRIALESNETLGRKFRAIAEIGQLLPRLNLRGPVSGRSASWNASLLYTTLMKYEPEHPLLREALREVLEDELDAPRAEEEARRIHTVPWAIYDLPRPSPLGLPLFAFFNREVVQAADPDRALDDLAESLYAEWGEQS